jgi:glycosyltransferase involved in cell wall biosynthesis
MATYKMTVLVVLQNSYIEVDRRVRREIEALREDGYRIFLICPEPPEGVMMAAIEDVVIFRYRRPSPGQGLWTYIREYAYSVYQTFRATALLRRSERIDVIHVCNPPDVFFPLKWLFLRIGGKFVFDQHDPAPEVYLSRFQRTSKLIYYALRLLELLTLRTADVVLVTNETARAMAVRRGKVNAEHVHVVRNGPFLVPNPEEEGDPDLKRGHLYMVCYMGAISCQDGVEYLIRAANYLINEKARKDICFTIVGSGSALERMKKLASDYQICEHVVFTGWIHEECQLSRYLQSADLCVSPEPSSKCNDISTFIKILDYMSFGKPIVAFDLKETRYSAGNAALYATPNCPRILGDKIEELLADENLRQRMGSCGRARISQHLCWEHSRIALLNAYRELLRRGGRR